MIPTQKNRNPPAFFPTSILAMTGLGIIFLGGCASREKVPSPTGPEIIAETSVEKQDGFVLVSGSRVSEPEKKDADRTVSSTQTRTQATQVVARPQTSPRRPAADWTNQVRSGMVTDRSQNLVVFVNPSARETSSSLYEDAILLSRVRGNLKAAKDVPPEVASLANLRQSTVTLRIPASLSDDIRARAVDASFAARGVTTVRVELQ